MASTEGAGGSRRSGMELEKFKRRMIRSVVRKLKEKKSDEDIWEDMKKEIGSNCKKLWERMRMLTLKKLKRLLEASDRVDMIGPVARMTLTDWLLFDLVIVHEKIDVIDREKLSGDYNSMVLNNLFSLVQRFNIEGRSGEDLAEAWTAATIYYNSKGHQCSPMMLQRRWYQIKELTRHKFYKFWFNYRGNHGKLHTAKQDSPGELQKAIALKYPQIVTQTFLDWEQRIENRLVILPEELGVKMRQKNFMKASDTSAPDVVLVEPRIEVIDLGANSDSEEENDADTTCVPEPPLVKIKSEPVDVDEEEIEYEPYIPPEKGSEFEEEIERLQRVEECFDENATRENVNSFKEVVIDPDPATVDSDELSHSNDVPEEIDSENGFTTLDTDVVSFSIVDGEITNVEKNEDAIVIDDDDDNETSPQNNASTDIVEQAETMVMLEDSVSVEKCSSRDATDSHVGKNVDYSTEFVPAISSVASVGVKVENVDDYIETDQITEQITGDLPDQLFPVISTVSSAGIKVERDLTIHNNIVVSDVAMETGENNDTEFFDQCDELTDVLPVITTVSSESIKLEIETQPTEENLQTEGPVTPINESRPSEDVVNIDENALNESTETLVLENNTKSNDLEEFGDILTDLNFADEGIDFADDGIEYVEDDEDDIITVRDPSPVKLESLKKETNENQENENEESSNKDEDTTSQKFDLKLLMYPVVYTTKLDAMTVFDDSSQYEHVHDKKTIDTIYALSKPTNKQSIKQEEHIDVKKEEIDTKHVKDDNDISASDDDLFRDQIIEHSSDSDTDSNIIDDSKRVKPTSYMLQKPKHRSYNPVLLCKNPDFNTRLKKLTVGFFMSARNRTLLQSCIPMTIDMSKSFEEKLINGTLYLKPAQTDSIPSMHIDDNVEVTSAALVKPSAVQQSLMSIDDALESELRKRMAERIRAINLPDISQVRRLNQHLLTAEVTPLRLETAHATNKLSTETRTAQKIGPASYIQKIKDDINNLLSQQQSKEMLNAESKENQPAPALVNPIPGVLPTSPVHIDSPVPRVEPTPPMVYISSPIPSAESLPPPPVVPSNATASNNTNTNNQPQTANKGGPKTRKPMRKTVYPTLAWNRRPCTQNSVNQELYRTDALLTIDTLYKMLGALDPCSNLNDPHSKKKNKKKNLKADGKIVENRIENQVNTDTVIDITDDEVSIKKPKLKGKGKSIRIKEKEYCCWCSYKISCIRGNHSESSAKRRHKCASAKLCECCCRNMYYTGDFPLTQSIPIEQEEHITESIEKVVQLVNVTPKDNDARRIDLEDNTVVEPMGDSTLNKAVLTLATDKSQNSLSLSSCNDASAELTPLHSSTNKHPTPKVRVYTGIPSILRRSSPVKSMTTLNVDVSPYTKDELNEPIPTPQETNVKPNAILSKSCTCRPNISKVNRGRIEINGRNNNCELHKVKKKQSKVVFSKKLVTNENQPFFVGKGKILLTSIKMPQNTAPCIETAAPAVNNDDLDTQVKVVRLPAGVQVVLLPDQTLTYIIQPNVSLTPEECAILPQFLVAIQQEINAVGITLPINHPVAKPDEVIDIDETHDNSEKSTAPNIVCATEATEPFLESTNEITTPETREDFEIVTDSTITKDTEILPSASEIDMGASTTSAIGKPEILVSETNNTDISSENESKSSNVDEANNKKSLLSDLMEMSGIMEEDLAPPPIQVEPPAPIILDTQNFVLHQQVPRENNPDVPATPKTQYTATNINGSFELTAVTSFAELKYSCDNNGLFFKLDLESGHLTSINVCIQKFPTKAQPQHDKSVIDLTDDPDISITGSTDGTESSTVNQSSVVTLNDEPSTPNKTQIATILQKKQRLMERLSNNLKPVNILQSKQHVARILKRNKSLLKHPQFTFYSKRKLDKIEAKIDLVDSDAPMEEEYLVQSEDSSDDEPLIKKVKRQRTDNLDDTSMETDKVASEQAEDTSSNNQSLEQENECEQEQSNVKNTSNGKEQVQRVYEDSGDKHVHGYSEDGYGEENLEDDEDLSDQEDDYLDEDEEVDDMRRPSAPPVPTNLVLSGGALNAHNIPLNTEYDDSQDDCILGV